MFWYASGVGDREGVEGLFPALSALAFDEAAKCLAFVAGSAVFLFAVPGPLIFDVADGQPEELDYGVVVGEVAAVFRFKLSGRPVVRA